MSVPLSPVIYQKGWEECYRTDRRGEQVSELAIAAVDRIIRRAGAERVSESAARELADILEERGIEISNFAIELARHAGQKTVRDEDILLAARRKT